MSEQLKLKLKTEHLLHLLEKGQTDEAFQVPSPRFKMFIVLCSNKKTEECKK